ncbi:hypothetical protein TWF730_007527 [Orbilia blumenaviensis]|uniref:Uncharacterized protein n=1 Tax=Orbilia blumenaviensis TaxID=1796055 RepID=A0AAV9VAF1_9PEZI
MRKESKRSEGRHDSWNTQFCAQQPPQTSPDSPSSKNYDVTEAPSRYAEPQLAIALPNIATVLEDLYIRPFEVDLAGNSDMRLPPLSSENLRRLQRNIDAQPPPPPSLSSSNADPTPDKRRVPATPKVSSPEKHALEPTFGLDVVRPTGSLWGGVDYAYWVWYEEARRFIHAKPSSTIRRTS